jgi:hypothetical protein
VPTFESSRRSWRASVGFLVVVVVTLGIVGVLFASTDTASRLFGGDSSGDNTPAVGIAEAIVFDPLGSGVEHDEELPLLRDGNPQTAWTTETYSTSRFGGLKDGVGVVLVLDRAAALGGLAVTSPSNGWSAQVYVADGPRESLEDWGEPVSTKSRIGDDTSTFSLNERSGGAVLLWITDLGPANQVKVAEVAVTG